MIGMMGGYGHMMGMGFPFGFGIAWWLGGAVVAALAGAVFAWIYNAVNASSGVAGSADPSGHGASTLK